MGSPSPSPSPSPSRPEVKHEVFISFRGEDTRDNFLSHLRKVFRDKGINAFNDDQLERGKEISPALLQAIKESQISVVIFSENYADSPWCLEELAMILECKQKHGQIVIPVFYRINPSDVRKQIGSYAAAFEKHKDRFKEDLEKVQKWGDDLKKVANISGFASSDVKDEAALVEKIVGDVREKLINTPSSEESKEEEGERQGEEFEEEEGERQGEESEEEEGERQGEEFEEEEDERQGEESEEEEEDDWRGEESMEEEGDWHGEESEEEEGDWHGEESEEEEDDWHGE